MKYLERCVETHELNLQGKRVVELGAGTGIVGISAAVLGSFDLHLWKFRDLTLNFRRSSDIIGFRQCS